MSPALIAGFFLFVLAAVSAAGYALVLRPSREEEAPVMLPATITLDTRSLPGATGALVGVLQSIGDAMPNQENQQALRQDLMAAGYRWPSAVSIFLGIKVASSLLLGIGLGWAAMVGNPGSGATWIAALCGLGFGYLLPDRILQRIAQQRVGELRRALPAALDLMVLAIEAGQGLDAAIIETSRGLRISYPELASEFTQLQLELRANAMRTDALRNFANRTRDMEMRKFANLLIDTDRFGTSLGPALKTHARYLRVRFRQTAQEKARKVGVKLIFPVFFLIFPSVMLVTLGPAVILLMTQMKSLLGN